MTEPVCFNLQERLMPTLRGRTARRLASHGLRQGKIAEHLGVSQAMVSKYLRQPDQDVPLAPPELVEQWVSGSVEQALLHDSKGAVAPFCPVCTALHESGAAVASAFAAEHCFAHDAPPSGQQRRAVEKELALAERALRRARLTKLQPAVRINLAMSTQQAKSTRDVAAFPGRLVDIKGRIRSVSSPEFGASSHLAGILVAVAATRPEHRAVINVRWADDVRHAASTAGLRIQKLVRKGKTLQIAVPIRAPVDAIVDPGGFGIEPALYVLGTGANNVIEKTLRILAKMAPTQDGKPQ